MTDAPRAPTFRRRSRPTSLPIVDEIDVTTSTGSVKDSQHFANDYVVGRGKPPKQHQFKPGQSGNPKGRPKGARGMKAMIRELLQKKITMRTTKGVRKVAHIEALLLKLLESGLKGDQRAIDRLLNQYADAVPDAIEPHHDVKLDELSATDAMILDQHRNQIIAGLGLGGANV